MSFFARILYLLILLPATGHARPDNFFVEWKERLFGARPAEPAVVDAPDDGVVVLGLERPERVRIPVDAEQREFPKGKSRYREVELQREFDHVALRIQVIAQRAREGRGNTVFKPVLYLLDDAGKVGESRTIEPLYLDIRPFKPTRLLACVSLQNVRRLAIATSGDAQGKSYESRARGSVRAPTRAGFHYSTEPVNVKLPWADTGELIIELIKEDRKGSGC